MGSGKKKNKKKNTVLCTLMGLRLGLGDSTDNAVQDSEVLQKGPQDKRQRSFRVSRQNICTLTGLFQQCLHHLGKCYHYCYLLQTSA